MKNINDFITENKDNVQILGTVKDKAVLLYIIKTGKKVTAKLVTFIGDNFTYLDSPEEFISIATKFQKEIIKIALREFKDQNAAKFVGIYNDSLVLHVYNTAHKDCKVGIPLYLIFDGNEIRYPKNPDEAAELRHIACAKSGR